MVLALGLMLVLASASCARGTNNGTGVATAMSGGPKASSNPTSTATPDKDTALKYAQCMRQHGLSWFPDPDSSGRTAVRIPNGTDKAKLDAANEACKQYAPPGPADGKADPQMVEQMRQLAKCMRANGVPNFPDPSADGSLAIDKSKVGSGPGDPTFDKAEAACSKYQPPGAKRGVTDNGGGSGQQGGTTGGQG